MLKWKSIQGKKEKTIVMRRALSIKILVVNSFLLFLLTIIQGLNLLYHFSQIINFKSIPIFLC